MLLTPLLEMYVCVMVFVFGAIIGSFLNVVIYRFHTGKSINGQSHCLSCQQILSWYELIPLLSYLYLRGRCRECASYIPPRYFLVELLTALGFLAIYLQGGTNIELVLWLVLWSLFIVIAVYDLYHFIIPNELVLAVSGVVGLWYSYQVYEGLELSALIPASLSALAAFAFYGGLWKVSQGRWIGFGDAKLAIPLGFMASFPAVFSMIVLSFWVGALVSGILIGLQYIAKRGQVRLVFFGTHLTMKSEIPFAPFLLLGFLLAVVYGVDVLDLIGYVL